MARAPLAAVAEQARTAAAYQPPLNSFGQPDLDGFWSNATLTPLTRQARLGTRAVYTPDEVKALESGAQKAEERGNSKSDPNAVSTGRQRRCRRL